MRSASPRRAGFAVRRTACSAHSRTVSDRRRGAPPENALTPLRRPRACASPLCRARAKRALAHTHRGGGAAGAAGARLHERCARRRPERLGGGQARREHEHGSDDGLAHLPCLDVVSTSR